MDYIYDRFYTPWCFTPREVFDTFDSTNLKIKKVVAEKKYGCHCKRDFAARVFIYCMYLILLDIIENNVTFVLPTIGREASIQMEVFEGDVFKMMYNKGYFNDIDPFDSDFTGYRLKYRWKSKNGIKEKPIYVNSTWKKRIAELANSGKKYY